MNCRRVVDRLPLAVGGDLPADEQREVDVHLGTCLCCYRAYQRYAAGFRDLDPLRAPASYPAPDGLFEAILRQVRAGAPGPAAEPLPRFRRPSWIDLVGVARRAAPLAAGFLLCVLAGYHLLGRTSAEPRLSAPPAAGAARAIDALGMPDEKPYESMLRTVDTRALSESLDPLDPGSGIVPARDARETGLPRVKPVPPARSNRAAGDY